MNIFQFLTIFWARRVLISAALVSCLIGALIVCAIIPPRWDSTARVVLNDVKPDTDTGQVISGAAMRYYINTQESLITDYTVAGRVAEQIGWFSEPTLIQAYATRPKNDQRDFAHFLADLIISHTKVDLIAGTNIIEINYSANTATGAQKVTDAIRKAYMAAALELTHQDARQNIAWYTTQLNTAKQALDAAVAAEAAFGRENGLVVQERGVDVDTAHLSSLVQQSAPSYLPNPPDQTTSNSSLQLAQVEASLTSATKTLGPNNPEVLELKSRQASLAALVARDRVAAQAAEARAMNGGSKFLERAVREQQTKVIANSEKIGRLNQLHQDVGLRSAEYKAAAEKLSHFRQLAASADTGITSLGNALTPDAPTFPNWLLIVPGAIVLGMGVGVFISLLLELLGRRIRTADDLNSDEDVPLICMISGPSSRTRSTASGAAKGRGWRNWIPQIRRPIGA
jgi:succinoglycan biosynthesis transport protein ExoP